MGYSIQPQTGAPAALQLAAGRRRPIGGPPDPYAAILAGLPKPLTGAQITSQAQGEINPLVQAATKQITGQTAAATHAIAGFTGDAAAKLGAIDFAAPYASGEQGQAAVDAALRDSLAGAGQQGADQLAQRLGVINDPSVGAAASALTANGSANGATQVAQGSASLGNLISDAASASEYGLKQPGIARLAGLQQIAAAGQQGQAAIAAKAAELEAQLPQIISNLQSRNDARATALADARQNQLARHDAIASAGAKNQTALQVAQAKSQAAIDVAQSKAGQAAAKANATAFQQDREYRLQWSKTYGYDPITGKTIPGYKRDVNGNVVKVSTAKPKAGAKPVSEYPNLTKGQVLHLRSGIASAFNGVPEQRDANNKVTQQALPPVSYQDAINHAVQAGYSRAAATKMANHFYAPGQRGRRGSVDPAKNPNDAGPPAPGP